MAKTLKEVVKKLRGKASKPAGVEIKEEVKDTITPEFKCANCEDSGRACYKCGTEN